MTSIYVRGSPIPLVRDTQIDHNGTARRGVIVRCNLCIVWRISVCVLPWPSYQSERAREIGHEIIILPDFPSSVGIGDAGNLFVTWIICVRIIGESLCHIGAARVLGD